ncbi:MAG: hypothetical protein QOC65_350 [Sphingomonadales bacterium]|nr:hypothetical protein [Sphingomonadales bacterium]
MSLHRKLLALAAPIALLGLSACATGLPTRVSRFQAMPAPQGQSFFIVPGDEKNAGGLEFSQYASLVSRHLTGLGYSEAPTRQAASMVVELDYGVDRGRQEVVVTPDPFGPWARGYGFGHRPFYSRYGYFGRHRSPFYYGWNDPFYFGGDRVNAYRVYTSHLDMDIRRAGDGQALFEGRAEARSRDDDLQELVPNLVEAMFTDFPGRSGERVRITVPPRRDRD